VTERKLRNPNARLQGIGIKPTEVQLKEIRDVLVDLWSLVSPYFSSVTADFTTSGKVAHEIVICANTSAITVTLHAKAKDGDQVTIKRTGTGSVTVSGNGNTIDGSSTIVLGSAYAGPHLIYTAAAGEWSIV